MRTRVVSLMACTLALVFSSELQGVAQQQSRGASSREVLFVDYPPPPPTLREFWDKASAVVHGTVKATSPPVADPASRRFPRAVRMQTLTVLEVLKDDRDRPIGREVMVQQFGGTLVVQGKEYATEYPASPFQPGDEVILFLSRSATDKAYSVLIPAAGAFAVDQVSRQVTIPTLARDRITTLRNQSSIAVDTFLATLRELKIRSVASLVR